MALEEGADNYLEQAVRPLRAGRPDPGGPAPRPAGRRPEQLRRRRAVAQRRRACSTGPSQRVYRNGTRSGAHAAGDGAAGLLHDPPGRGDDARAPAGGGLGLDLPDEHAVGGHPGGRAPAGAEDRTQAGSPELITHRARGSATDSPRRSKGPEDVGTRRSRWALALLPSRRRSLGCWAAARAGAAPRRAAAGRRASALRGDWLLAARRRSSACVAVRRPGPLWERRDASLAPPAGRAGGRGGPRTGGCCSPGSTTS